MAGKKGRITTRTQNVVRPLKETSEIREIVENANMDYETVVNRALNDYLSRIFITCPFTNDLCIHRKQCIGCESSGLK